VPSSYRVFLILLVYRENGGHSTTYEDGKAVLEFVIRSAIQKDRVH